MEVSKTKKFPPNNLKYFRELKGLTQEELGKAAGCTAQFIYYLEAQDRELNGHWRTVLAPILGRLPIDLLSVDKPLMVQPVGYISEGGEVVYYSANAKKEPITAPAGSPLNTAVLEGESLHPGSKDNWFYYYIPKEISDISTLIGEFCVIETNQGKTYAAVIKKGYAKDKYNLMEGRSGIIEDVDILWASRIFDIRPSKS